MRTKRSVAIIMLLVALFAALILCFISLTPAQALAAGTDDPDLSAGEAGEEAEPGTGGGGR